ncbi:MAG: antitoxin family protein, partial [Candidatus Competibacteraceae bacterium]
AGVPGQPAADAENAGFGTGAGVFRGVGGNSMTTAFHAVYENGVFRPTRKMDLPDRCEVAVEIHQVRVERVKPGLDDTYALLSERFDSGEHDIAARHNEHRPWRGSFSTR